MHVWQIVLLTSLLATLWACGGSRSKPVVVRSDGVELAVSVEPADLRVGKNAIWLEIRDRGGAPVTAANVEVKVQMHAMVFE